MALVIVVAAVAAVVVLVGRPGRPRPPVRRGTPSMPGYFSTPSRMPGTIVEPLFITDPFEGSIAASTEGRDLIASGIAQAVEQYFGPPSVPALDDR